MPVEPLPEGLSRARKATKELWESFFTTGRWSAWDDTQRALARSLIRTFDEAERAKPTPKDGKASTRHTLLLREVRLTSGRLGLLDPPKQRKGVVQRDPDAVHHPSWVRMSEEVEAYKDELDALPIEARAERELDVLA